MAAPSSEPAADVGFDTGDDAGLEPADASNDTPDETIVDAAEDEALGEDFSPDDNDGEEDSGNEPALDATNDPLDPARLLGPELWAALEKKGYVTLTPVQRAVLDPGLVGRDLRVSSQTGSGKTLAIGFLLRHALARFERSNAKVARPKALVIVPTRELAKQVEAELGWLYAGLKVRIAAVIGGASYRDELRALARGPALVVGTPGRLLDHLNREAIDASEVEAVVLDEADRMLDLGFREELEAILAKAPEGHRTHLVSATFAPEVTALAGRVQTEPARVEGTPLGSANRDIDHVVYLARPEQRIDALVNVLLYHPSEPTLIFARTRVEVADIARALTQAGFATASLSGELQQAARERALEAFKRGEVKALVATDVAARGIDVQGIARVVQVDPPSDAETYVHRAGRTGRAGRKGTSALLIAPSAWRRAASLLERAGVEYRLVAVPTREQVEAAQDERLLAELAEPRDVGERIRARVAKIVESGLTERALELFLSRAALGGKPRDVTLVSPPNERRKGAVSGRVAAPMRRGAEAWVPFKITWGEAHGADARRLVAMLCRRGGIRGSDIGAIEVKRFASIVEVSAHVAEGFARRARKPDPRDPRVVVAPLDEPGRQARAPGRQFGARTAERRVRGEGERGEAARFEREESEFEEAPISETRAAKGPGGEQRYAKERGAGEGQSESQGVGAKRGYAKERYAKERGAGEGQSESQGFGAKRGYAKERYAKERFGEQGGAKRFTRSEGKAEPFERRAEQERRRAPEKGKAGHFERRAAAQGEKPARRPGGESRVFSEAARALEGGQRPPKRRVRAK